MPEVTRVTLSVTILPENREWIESQVKVGRFRNLSHAVEEGIMALRESTEQKEAGNA